MNDDLGLVIISAPPGAAGNTIARTLVDNKAAACVQIIPGVSSIYRWKGEVESDPETLLFVKTCRSKLEEIEGLLKDIHPYELPELVFIPILGGSEKYLAWIRDNLSGA